MGRGVRLAYEECRAARRTRKLGVSFTSNDGGSGPEASRDGGVDKRNRDGRVRGISWGRTVGVSRCTSARRCAFLAQNCGEPADSGKRSDPSPSELPFVSPCLASFSGFSAVADARQGR